MVKKCLACVFAVALLFTLTASQLSVSAETSANLDLSGLSDLYENKTESGDAYAYTFTVQEVNEKTVRTLELTLDGAAIDTLTLPCKSSDELHIIIDTRADSTIKEFAESHVFNYSYQWDSITFKGDGALTIEFFPLQGGGDNHSITVSDKTTVSIIGDALYGLNFGASGSNSSTLNVDGTLSVNGDILCGQVVVGKNGSLTCKRLTLAGIGAFDTDGYQNAFVLSEGGTFVALGDSDWIDDATGEQYAALMVHLSSENTAAVEAILCIPADYLPDGYALFMLVDCFATIDDGDEVPIDGVIYAATSLSLAPAEETDEPIEPNEPTEPVVPNPPTGVDDISWAIVLLIGSIGVLTLTRKKLTTN